MMTLRNKPRESPETFVKKPKKAVKKKKKRTPGKPKAPRKPKAPKTRCSGTMTEAAFWSFIRSSLRQKSRRWKPIYDCLNTARRPSKSDNKRLKWEYQCKQCGCWGSAKEVSVDHAIPAGSLRCGDDLSGFVSRLFCETDGLQVLCNECHAVKTNKERNGYNEND